MQSNSVDIGRIRKKFWIFFLSTVAIFLFTRIIIGNLDGKTIVEFEIAKTTEVASSLINRLGETGVRNLINSIYADFLFLVGYGGTLFYSCRYFGFLSKNFLLQKSGKVFSFLGLIASLSDIFENVGMLFTLKQEPVGWITRLTYDASRIKFSLILITLLFVIICWFFRGIESFGQKMSINKVE